MKGELLPIDFRERMKSSLGEDYPKFIAQYDFEALRGYRVNTLKTDFETLNELFPYDLGQVPWCSDGHYYNIRAGKHPCSLCGLIYSQEPSAMIAAQKLNPSPGDKVLDLCAAPGGKSTHIAALLKGEGFLVSNEIVQSRAMVLAENIERMGIKNALVTNMSPEKLEKEFPLYFDKILVDAPCSGEGMFRRDETAISEWSKEHVSSCAKRQRLILESAVKMLRGGGEMVYSTCTFSKEENEDNALWLTKTYPELSLVSMDKIMPHTHKGEGHFAAHFIKSGNGYIPRKELSQKADTSLFDKFKKENLNIDLEGTIIGFKDRLYLVPKDFGTIDRLKLVRAGLYLGENKKGRFEPSHSLAMALTKKDFRRIIEINDTQLSQFYSGNTIDAPNSENGYTAVLYKGFPVGWGKAVGGVVKNHIPKFLRF